MSRTLFAHPLAFIPIAMSLAALGVLLVTAAMFGITRQPDEGTAAHLWQLLMAGQLPVIALFVVRWVPASPKAASLVVLAQLAAAGAAMFPVWWFGL